MIKKFIQFVKAKCVGPLFLVVDLFCGFGGTTTGYDNAMYVGSDGRLHKAAKVIACVNHDPKAIKSHWLNHPDVRHFEEDIRTLNLSELIALVNYWRRIYPNAYVVLWASLECTNFSKAKGGQAREADSRTLSLHLYRYQVALNPDYIKIENVVEFMAWGPMKAKVYINDGGYEVCHILCFKEVEEPVINSYGLYALLPDGNVKIKKCIKPFYMGVPDSKDNGKEWVRWRNTMNSLGYYDEWKQINSADLGAYTSRNRLFGCFAKQGLPIIWPEPTHCKVIPKGRKNHILQQQMFGRGLQPWKAVKEVLNFEDEGESIFNRKKDLVPATLERIYAGLIKYVANGDTSFLSKYFSGRPTGKVKSIYDPASAITVFGGQTLIQTTFLVNYYGKSGHHSSIENPAPVIPTKDRISIINSKFFIDKYFGKSSQNQSISQPAGVLMPNDKHRIVEATPFVMPTNYDNGPKSINDPCPVITANRKHHYIVNPSHGGHSTSTDNPCPVIIARQDKAPLYLVQGIEGNFSIPVYDTDCAAMIKIKQFMAAYGLVDIKMRMLRVAELLKIQGFPEGYKMVGNQSDHKKFIGNSVVPHVVKAWCEAFVNRLDYNRKTA